MDSNKTGLIIGGVLLAAGAGVGIYFLAKKYKEPGTAGLGAFRQPPLYRGDWNVNHENAWKNQHGRLYAQRKGIPQVF